MFVPVRLVDNTGSVQVRMRESAALELSGLTDKNAFIAAVREADLSFPMFSSIRVLIRDKGSETLPATGAAEPSEPEDTILIVIHRRSRGAVIGNGLPPE